MQVPCHLLSHWGKMKFRQVKQSSANCFFFPQPLPLVPSAMQPHSEESWQSHQTEKWCHRKGKLFPASPVPWFGTPHIYNNSSPRKMEEVIRKRGGRWATCDDAAAEETPLKWWPNRPFFSHYVLLLICYRI